MLAVPFPVDEWIALRGLTRAELQRRFTIGAQDIEEHVAYQQLKPVARLHHAAAHPGYFYVRGEQQVMLYLNRAAVATLTPEALETHLGGPGVALASRAGKRATLHVYPQPGVAFSQEDGQVQFIEIFSPTTLADYQAQIYIQPGPFIK